MTDVLTPSPKQAFFDNNGNPLTGAARAAARHKAWVGANRDWKRRYDREYRRRNPEKAREKDRANYQRHAEKKREKSRLAARARPQVRRAYLGYPEPTRPMPEMCECCGTARGKKSLHLDHDHAIGKFRGWLCTRCNLGVGYFKDSVERLSAAIAYLERAK